MALKHLWEPLRDSGEVGETRRARRYFVAWTEPDDRDVVIWRARPQLLRGAPHPTMPLWVLDSRADRRDGQNVWDVEVEYGFLPQHEREKNPLARPAVFSSSWESITVATLLDAKGRVMRNAAGDPFDAQERRSSHRVIKVRKNIPVEPSPEWIDFFENAVNDAPVRIRGRSYPKHSLLFVPGEESEPQYQQAGDGKEYGWREVNFSFVHNRRTWNQQIVNQGLNESRSVLDKELLERRGEVRFVRGTRPLLIGNEGEEEHPTEPFLLDKDGKAFRDKSGQPTNDVEPHKIVILEFEVYRALPFGRLPIK